MEDRDWKSVHREISIYSHLLSFTFLIAVWIALGFLKYRLYGVAGWGYHWNIKASSFWLQARTFVRFHVQPYALYMIAGVAADFFAGRISRGRRTR